MTSRSTSPRSSAPVTTLLTTVPTTFAENAGSLIPNFTQPARTWANRIRFILLSRKLDLTKDEVSEVFLPLILARLPTYLLQLVHDKKLDELLSFLETFDKAPVDLLSVLTSCKNFEYDPSIEYSRIVDKVKTSIGKGITDKAAKIVSYGILVNMFPPHIQTQLALLDVIDHPNQDQLARIDRMYHKYTSESTGQQSSSSHIIANSNESVLISKLDTIMSRLTVLESRFQQTPAANPIPIQQRITYPQQQPNTSRHYPNPNMQQQRFVRTDNPNYCYYHNMYGPRAHKCVAPCTYNRSKNADGAPATP